MKASTLLLRIVEVGLVVASVGFVGHAVVTKVGVTTLLEEPASTASSAGDADEDADEDDEKAKKTKPGFDFSGGLGGASGGRNTKAVLERILAFDPFCPTCKPPETAAGPGDVGTSSLPLVLVATMEAEDPRRSLATILDPDTESVGVYGVGEPVRPGVVLASVERTRVLLQRGNAMEALELGAETPKKSKKKGKKSKGKKKKKKSKAYIEGAEEAIDCPSESLCIVERAFVEKLIANPTALAKQARVVPKKQDGEQVGLKFYGIRRDSLPKMLGLKNGDMLVSVNGEDLTSMDKVMSLYMKLRNASNLTVVLDRKGKRITKEIQIK
ncbi:MAG: hypothetical protein D6705_07250 [Deltaproteobacteria bacterium]|nr:MAG: hypothetical protein D6705_07250 [Deltaproteobacteria bacterium]